jgi:hypothetical protein
MADQVRRRPVYRDDHEFADKFDSSMPVYYLKGAIEKRLAYLEVTVLMAMCYHQDIINKAGDSAPTYAEDITRVLGISVPRVGSLLRILHKSGLIVGSAAAGYELVP